MGFLSFLFGGKYPSTKKYEAQRAQHAIDYEHFKQVAESKELARYYELEARTGDAKFKASVDRLQHEKFTDTDAYKKFVEYENLKKSKEMTSYFKFKEKGLNQKLTECQNSSNYKRFQELEKEVKTPEFAQKKRAGMESAKRLEKIMLSLGLKKTPEMETFDEWKKLNSCSEKKFIERTLPSWEYQNFKTIDGSEQLAHYQALEAYVKSEQFLKFRAELEDKHRFQKSEEYALLQEFEKLKKDKTLVWYFESEKNGVFQDLIKWKEVFNDEFNTGRLDEKKWMVGYYWGKVLMGDTYSLENERQCFKKENILLAENHLSIVTRPEKAKGKRWVLTNNLGFVDDEFDITSSIINTGSSFRQQYGRFVFKVKASFSKPIEHTIWMVGEKMTPHITVAHFGEKKKTFDIGVISHTDNVKKTIDGANFASDYYIISLMWTPERLVWTVNGVEVYTHSGSIPQEPMYIVISSNITKEGEVKGGTLDLDWVKCYTWKK